MRKIVALLLSLAMLLTILSGCGKQEAEEPATSDAVEENDAKEETNEEATESEVESSDPVKLRLVMYGTSTSRRDEYFSEDFHDRVLEELNIDFSIEWLPWSEMNGTTITNMLASGENIAFENIMSFNDYHAKGYVATIDSSDIEELMPEYLAMRGENNGFDCCTYQGDIYCIPIGNKPYAGRHQTITVRNDILNEVGWDYSDIETYDDLMEAIAAVKEKYPDMYVMYGTGSLKYSLAYELAGVSTGEFSSEYAYVNEIEDNDVVYSYYESDLFEKYSKLMAEWVELGYQGDDVLTNAGQGQVEWTAGNCLLYYGVPGNLIETTLKIQFPESDIKNIKIGDFPFVKTRDFDWGISFSAAAKDDISSWLKLINWMYKDIDTYNFCVYGVEGTDWERAEDGTITKLCDDSFWDDWFMEAADFVVFDSNVSDENIELYKANDDGSKLSKLSGFTFDPTPVQTEVALMDAVVDEYLKPIYLGFLDYDENYPDAIAKLKEAGLDTYMEEYQKQFSEFYNNN